MKIIAIIPILFLAACNAMHVKPNTMERNSTIYVERGGGLVKLAAKANLEKRGYTLTAGTLGASRALDNDSRVSDDYAKLPSSVDYVLTIKEQSKSFYPIWCFFNGFWMLSYNISIVDNKNGEELLLWTGYACTNTVVNMMNRTLDELEKNLEISKSKNWHSIHRR